MKIQFRLKYSVSFFLCSAMLSVFAQNPIVFSLYTVHNNILKISAQLDPSLANSNQKIVLEVQEGGNWVQKADADVITPGWNGVLRVENWDMTIDHNYRIKHLTGEWTGVIRKDPVDKEKIIAVVFTGNSINPNHGGDLSKQDLVDNVVKHGADVLIFTGDQVYNHTQHERDWQVFGRDFGEIMRDIPTVSIPDDHDAGQANLWGSSGKNITSNCDGGTSGGYCQPGDYVKMVERSQTGNLPDPYDPTPIGQGIGVYYTSMIVGGIDFAIIEDRKFKTGPQEVLSEKPGTSRWDHINDPDFDVTSIDVPEAIMLGDRQLAFLADWGTKWSGVEMKATISATMFGGLATHHGGPNARLIGDMDSNGWPQTGRNKALDAIRRSFSFMIGGDQHLTTTVWHGIDDWRDAGWSFGVPSIANLYLRYWKPEEEGLNKDASMTLPYTGDYLDGFGNKITFYAHSNPGTDSRTPTLLFNRSAGYGVVEFNKTTRKITFAAWPRIVDPNEPGATPYPGWPITIDQQDNYGREPVNFLPTLEINGMVDPVVQIINEATGEVIYTLRIKGNTFKPKVFEPGTYTIKVGELGTNEETVITGVQSLPLTSTETLVVNVGAAIERPRNKIQGQGNIALVKQPGANAVQIKIYGTGVYKVEVHDARGSVSLTRKIQGPGEFYLPLSYKHKGPAVITATYRGKLVKKLLLGKK